jgi:hypothetical protein
MKENYNMKKSNPRNYVDKQKLHDSLVEWQELIRKAEENGEPRPQLPLYTAKAIMNIARHTASSASFRTYSWREDMEAKAMLNMVIKAEKYDPNREDANAFAFFSFITSNTFKEYIPNEKRQYMSVKKYKLETLDIDTLTNGDMSNSSHSNAVSSVQNNALTLELYTQEVSEVAQYDLNENLKKSKRKARLAELKALRENDEEPSINDLI